MKPLIFALCVVFAFDGLCAQQTAWQPLPGHMQVSIWPGRVPDPQPVAGPEVAKTTEKEFLVAGRPAVGVSNVSRPTMTVYTPNGKNTGAAVVVRMVAITFDDLPIAETDISAGTIDASETRTINRVILESLRRHKVPATGFVIEKTVEDVGEIPGREILWQWVESGNDLGNHSYSHPDFNQLTIEQMEREIVSGERSISEILGKVGRTPRYFRFPMNHTGDTVAKHDAVAAFLTQRGYKLAVCTIDNEDYVFDRAYLLALARKDNASAERLRSEYLSYTGTEIDYYSALNKHVFGYEPPHVMLLHVNRLNADTIDGVLNLFEQKHYTFVSLDKAEADQAFATPGTFVTPYGWMWGYRWARERHVTVNGSLETEPPAWVSEYGKK